MRASFFLREYLATLAPLGGGGRGGGTSSKPPECMVEEGTTRRITPPAAEAKAGRGARKNWRESFKLVGDGGRIMTLKAYFAFHNIA